MDRNGDGVITRAEWRGTAQAFDQEDWNGDGILSGDEVRVGAQPPRGGATRRTTGLNWTEDQFRLLDRNGDNRISRSEWRDDPEEFLRADRNADSFLSLNEFLSADPGSLTNSGRGRGAQSGGRNTPEPILVSSREAWTDTAIDVRAGDLLSIRAVGTIQYSDKADATAGPDGAPGRPATKRAPLPREVIGALIARVGSAAPFFVGATPDAIRATRSGRLYLGVNDDVLNDNRGDFRVTVTVTRGAGR